MRRVYQVLPSSRVWPFGSAVRRNSPRRDSRKPSRCGGATVLYGVSSRSGRGELRTSNDSRCPGSQRVIGSTNGPVENTQ